MQTGMMGTRQEGTSQQQCQLTNNMSEIVTQPHGRFSASTVVRKQHLSTRLIALALLFAVLVLLTNSATASASSYKKSGGSPFNPYTPIFTKAEVKIAETADSRFTAQLLNEAINYEPLLFTNQTQVNMGFWSGPGNHGSLVRLLDSINVGCVKGDAPNCAIWDEGATSSQQFPAFVTMLQEHWYERGTAGDNPTVTIYGKTYKNKNPLDLPTADQIWGQYSQRYADMAREFHRQTGKPVVAWAYVQGASPTRIFYTYEYHVLQQLEAEGVVEVFCANSQDSDWKDASDWTTGTGSASCPDPA